MTEHHWLIKMSDFDRLMIAKREVERLEFENAKLRLRLSAALKAAGMTTV